MKLPVFKILSVFALLASSAAFVRAEVPTINALLGQAQTAIVNAAHRNDPKALEGAKLIIDKALALEPKNTWAWYFKGHAAYIDYVLMGQKKDNLAKETALNDADQALQKSIEQQPTGEALAMHSSVLAGLIGVRGGESGAQLGPRIGQEMARARELAPQNPRVLMTAGVSALFTPPEWGGDVQEAVKLLEKALAAFEEEHPPAPQPTWGLADTHVWLGLAYQKLGDNTKAKAKAEFEKALALDPNYGWVSSVLLPGLDKPTK